MLSRHFRLYLTVALLSAILMTFQSSHGPLRPFAFFARAINNINHTITITFDSTAATMRAIGRDMVDISRTEAEIRDLKLQLMDREELRKANVRVREMLAFKISEPRQVAIAKVISRSALSWSSSMIIDMGTSDGVKKDMAVITPEGLVGKILEARPYYSVVLLVTDSRFSAAVRLHKTREDAVLTGDGAGGCVVKYLNRGARVDPGETMYTRGLDALFPNGIPAASARSLKGDEKELFHTVEATPLALLDTLEEVIVVER